LKLTSRRGPDRRSPRAGLCRPLTYVHLGKSVIHLEDLYYVLSTPPVSISLDVSVFSDDVLSESVCFCIITSFTRLCLCCRMVHAAEGRRIALYLSMISICVLCSSDLGNFFVELGCLAVSGDVLVLAVSPTSGDVLVLAVSPTSGDVLVLAVSPTSYPRFKQSAPGLQLGLCLNQSGFDSDGHKHDRDGHNHDGHKQ